jgi:hypothetical protein
VHDVSGTADRLPDSLRVEDIGLDEGEVPVAAELASGERVPVKIVEEDDLVVVDEPARERGSDETGAASEHNALTVKRHAASVVVLLVALAGCGSDGGGGPGEATGSVTELQILVWEQGARPTSLGRILGERRTPIGKPTSWTLRCDPPGGTFPDAEGACGELDNLDQPFAETPEEAVCTQQYGGPEVASVNGVYRDETVNTRFSRDDGCEIGRWRKHAFLFSGKP